MKRYLQSYFSTALAVTLLTTSGFGLAIDAAFAGSKFRAPRMGSPGNREAGAARSDTCVVTKGTGLMAVLPSTNLGLTTKAYPTFFAYIPPNNAETAEFRLIEEETGEEVFAGQVQMPKADAANSTYKHKASVIGIPLPKTGFAQGLQSGKNYQWALMVVCNAKNRAEDIVVTGAVQRINNEYINTLDPETTKQLSRLNNAPVQERLAIYGAAGIWQDLLADVATLAKKNPATYGEEWKSLLTDQGMGAIATVPIAESKVEPLIK